MMEQDKDGRFPSGRATLASPQAPAGLGHSESIANAKDGATLAGFKWPLMAYAPGGYDGKCYSCGGHFWGLDKRAGSCLKCALEITLANSEAYERALRIAVWNDAKERGLSDRAAMEKVNERIAACHAQAIGARSGETSQEARSGTDESAVAEPCAQTPPGETK